MSKYKTRRDINHLPIVMDLRKRGVEVIDFAHVGNVPDILCKYRDFIGFIEIKIPGSRASYQTKQLRFMSNTKFPVAICKSLDEAMTFLETGEGLTQKQKDALAGLVRTVDRIAVHPAMVEKVLEAVGR